MVVVTLDGVTLNYMGWAAQITGKIDMNWVQKSALIETNEILRQFLKLSGF